MRDLQDTQVSRTNVEWSATAASFPKNECIHQLFEQQVERNPQAVALVHEGRRMSYGELNRAANRLAHKLRKMGVGADKGVAICADRSLEMVVGLLGILKAGGGYVPLDPAYPAERLAYMLKDSGAEMVLVQGEGRNSIETSGREVLDLEADAWRWAEERESNLEPESIGLKSEHLAYIIYTSGSTGLPKGVMVEHRNVVRLFSATEDWFHFGSQDVWTLFHSFAFDFSVWEIWGALAYGGRLAVVSRDTARSPEAFYRLLCQEKVTVLNQTPSAFRQLVAAQEESDGEHGLRYIVFGGEALEVHTLKPWYQQERNRATKLINMYGITETTVHVTYRELDEADTLLEGRSPIGVGIPDLKIYILDESRNPVPIGAKGELYVAGAGVARGYLNRPELTAERFVRDPFSGVAEGRMYKTGDLGRYLADGNIEYLGRNDHQVKIRGFRIELGEIEAKLAACAGVREAVVMTREDSPGDKRLVAYVRLEEGKRLDVEGMRKELSLVLPEYMVPGAYVEMEKFLLTANGKLDRKALPAPDSRAYGKREYEAPVGEVEQELARIWAEVLKVEGVGRRDNFFDLGGHSLLAVTMLSRVRGRLGVEVGVKEVFAHAVLEELGRVVERGEKREQEEMKVVSREGDLPLSYAQQRLWFLAQMEGGSQAYHIPVGVRLVGDLKVEGLKWALDRMVNRHEVIRSRFERVGEETVQRIGGAERGFGLEEHDLRGRGVDVERWMGEEVRRGFDLEKGPVVRGQLLRVGEREHVLLLTMHHIVCDGWSLGIVKRELSELYGAYCAAGSEGSEGSEDRLPMLEVQYADYAVWQRERLRGRVREEQGEHWRERLEGAPAVLELPVDRVRPVQQRYEGETVEVEIEEELTEKLKGLGRRHGATLYMVVLAAWGVVLRRMSGQEEVVIGTAVAGRTRREVEGLIGFFVNTQALRLKGQGRVGEVVSEARERVVEAQENQELPFEEVVELVKAPRSLSHTPVFQVMLAWQNREGRLDFPGVVSSPIPVPYNIARFDLEMELREEEGEKVRGGLKYATSLFERSTIERHAGYLRRVLEEMVADEEQEADGIELLSAEERHRLLVEWNATAAPFPEHECIHQLFEQQVERNPAARAVIYEEDQSLSYAGLNAEANRLAHYLIELGVKPDDRVAICAERSLGMVVGLLGTLKAGGAYVPLDTAYPAERLKHILTDAAPMIVLADAKGREALGREAVAGLKVLELDGVGAAGTMPADWSSKPAINPEAKLLGLNSRHAAYVICTSGSTGKPKGAINEHRALINRLLWMQASYGLDSSDVILQKTSFSFDVSVWEFFWPLLTGATLAMALPGAHKDPLQIIELIQRWKVTTLHFVPSMLSAFLSSKGVEGCTTLRRLICSGEALQGHQVREYQQKISWSEMHNLYGPTEAAIDVTAWACPRHFAGTTVPIGRPIANTQIYLLDERRQPAPQGAVGEIYIGGAGVARGYLNRPELTAERFVRDPFSGVAEGRMYKTGDLGRYLRDGNIEYLGRNDHQVKIRGFRIELGEIEAKLAACAGVREAVVMTREDSPGDKRLVAYVRLEEGKRLDVEGMRKELSLVLPEYMVPGAYVEMEKFLLTANGKLDRKALPAPDSRAYGKREYEAPVGEVEQELARIWAEVLKVEGVGRRDNFFDLGGHSLLAVTMLSRVRGRLGVEVGVKEVFAHAVLEELGRVVERGEKREQEEMKVVSREGDLPLSYAQQRLWFLAQMEGGSQAYHIPVGVRLVGDLKVEGLKWALDRMVNRHEVIRSRFERVGEETVQRIGGAERGFGLEEHDLRGRGVDVERWMGEEVRRGFDLEKGPVVRGQLLRVGEREHVLLLTMHHIVCDGWSLGIVKRELSELYGAYCAAGSEGSEGSEDRLPMLEVQYADYAVWQRERLRGRVREEQGEYWRERLEGAPAVLELPVDRVRPVQQRYEGETVEVEIEEELTEKLKGLGRRHGATLYMVVLAAWGVVLRRMSWQEEVVIGTAVAGRTRREVEPLIGFFVNTQALRLKGQGRVGEAVSEARERVVEAQENQELPFEEVVELVKAPRSLSHTPVFQVMLAWQNREEARLELPGVQASPLAVADEIARFDLELDLGEEGRKVRGGLKYATSLFERSTIERHAGYLRQVLEEMVADEEQEADEIKLLSAEERHRLLVEWNATEASLPKNECIHQLFEQQVERNGEAIALAHEGRRMSYGELNRAANRLAHRLRKMGVGADDRVAICAERSLGMVVGLLGILKAGGGYVPLDPAYPAERLAYMLKDSGAEVVLVQGEGRNAIETGGRDVLDLEADEWRWAEELESNLEPESIGLRSEHLAYIIYTSGSTGLPKGVMVEHRNVVNLIHAHIKNCALVASDVVLQFASIAFDASVEEIFPPLAVGARVVLRPSRMFAPDREYLRLLHDEGITVAELPTAFWHHWVQQKKEQEYAEARDLRLVVVGGEKAERRYLDQWRSSAPGSNCHWLNTYGPTETTVYSTSLLANQSYRSGEDEIPIGYPIANTQIYILSASHQLVPTGVAGEIYIGGAGVARGYLNRPELTDERFIANPFVAGERIYKTGDLGRWRSDGQIEYLGRNDDQVKIRGFRIELGEVEAKLAACPGISETVVIAREDIPGDKRLVAYFVAQDGPHLSTSHLREQLAAVLPAYMVPSAFVQLDVLPLTPTGKLERKALPAPEADAYVSREYHAPVGAVENALAQIWAEVLKLERVGRYDNFFELGGHSLLIVTLIERMRRANLRADVCSLFMTPVLADLAHATEELTEIIL